MAGTESVAAARGRRVFGRWVVPTVSLAGAGAGIFVWRTFSWPSASSNDAWAYAAWGQALGRGEQLVYNLATTPKPLASALAAIVSPLPPTRAWALIIALSLGILVAGLLAAGYREAGTLGGAVAAVAFVFAAPLDRVIWFSLVDALTAALVVLALALRGRARIIPLVLAGLLRPEAWPAGALAGFVETTGSRLRRSLAAVAAGVLPLAVWALFDLALAGDALATQRFREGGSDVGVRVSQSLGDAFDLFRGALMVESGAAFAVVGGVGLLVHGFRRSRAGVFPWPVALGLVWTIGIVAQTIYGLELNARYLLPLVAILAVGWGLLCGEITPSALERRRIWIWVAAAAAVAATALAVARMEFGSLAQKSESDGLAVRRSVAAVEPVLDCGRLGLVGGRYVYSTMARLAATTRTSLTRFERVEFGPVSGYAGILAVRGRDAESLPDWPTRRTPLGPLAVSPDCSAGLG